MTKTVARKAAAKLRKAARLMNHGGTHWTKNTMGRLIDGGCIYPEDEIDPKTCQFCAVGGLRVACFGNPEKVDLSDDVYAAALEALVRSAPRGQRYYAGSNVADATPAQAIAHSKKLYLEVEDEDYEPDVEGFRCDLEGLVIGFNDATDTTWKDVAKSFDRAAKRVEKDAGITA